MSAVERVAVFVGGWALFEMARTIYAWSRVRGMRLRCSLELITAANVLVGETLVITTQLARTPWLIVAAGNVILWALGVMRARAFRAHMTRLDEDVTLLETAIAMQEAAAERAVGRHDH